MSLEVIETLPAGFEPSGVVVDSNGSTLYVANRLSNDVFVIDLKPGLGKIRLLAGSCASYLSLSPNDQSIYFTHIYPIDDAFRIDTKSEITVIDTASQTVVERKTLHNVAGMFHLAI